MTESKLPISVVLLTRNEERNISACLESCSFAQEVILVDDGSVDQTVQLASDAGAKVFLHAMNGDWGAQQSYGIAQATCPWILLLDADERVTPRLQQAIREVTRSSRIDSSYEIQRENHFVSGNASHGVVRPDWVLRLMPREGASVVGKVHPAIVTPFTSKRLKGRLIHFPYSSWDSYFRKFDKYTKLAAEKTDIAVIVVDSQAGFGEQEEKLLNRMQEKQIPCGLVFNKMDPWLFRWKTRIHFLCESLFLYYGQVRALLLLEKLRRQNLTEKRRARAGALVIFTDLPTEGISSYRRRDVAPH